MAFSQTALTEREYYFTTLPHSEPPESFHPTQPAKPTAPLFPDGLTQPEQYEVFLWLSTGTAATLPNAEAKIAQYVAHQKAMRAWDYADHLARITQHRWALADSSVLNKWVVAASSSVTGVGSAAPPNYIPQQVNQPD